ncbi:hypothetical protein BV25DRAFT_1895369 [Artomyces pyxidatus]|uniref:Uncharacterized protein n=1 Tax=Artomyces pyxidatus TaxID=48021 RepID=A0ACB8SHN7_9AGAM|nr:hypothetical protein BV25DRAFT_1895369 [Artomyces pyxidatus]
MASSLSITSLLNSLHTHLQSQTQLLPTLHAQLGLPPTALADELSTLQNKLTQCIEDQIDGRRKQVHGWVARCEEVEEECHRYGVALGSSVNLGAGTVGELKKEQVVPRRYEMLTALQEKLRQLYHTKLEQLSTLTNRLAAMSRTLGDDFFSDDVLDPRSANDSATHRDVTPERFSRLEKELVRGKGEVAKRLAHLSSTFVHIDWLHDQLGIDTPAADEIPSCSSLGVPPVSRPSSALGSHDPFICTPTPYSRQNIGNSTFILGDPNASSDEHIHQQIFARFAARLDEADDEALLEGRLTGLEGVEPTPALLTWAADTRASLEDMHRKRAAHIQAMYDQLEGLWRRLGVPDESMDGFVEAHRGCTEETVREYEEELERMLELKRERMSTFVENARVEVTKLWDELMVGEEERADFAPFYDDEHTEELLIIHEDEIKRLKDERRMKAHLLGSIRKYFEICKEEQELANTASDQGRLLGRGPRDPGRLLREEKMRKRVQKEKPRIEQDLLASIPAWEAEAGRPFLAHGKHMLEILMPAGAPSDKENRRANSANGSYRPGTRAGSVPPRATTPSYGSGSSSNSHQGGGRGTVTPAVRSASSMSNGSQSAPNKRPRLGDSGNAGTATGGRARAASPSKIAMPVPSRIPSTSILPRAVSVPRIGTQHHALGHGRVPSAQQQQQQAHDKLGASLSNSVYRPVSSVSSQMSLGASASSYRSAPSLASSTSRKAARARRESFRPRPSVEGPWAPGLGTGRYGGLGFAGGVKEEEED